MDITTVTVENDDTGIITIHVAGPATPDVFTLMTIFLDSDRTPTRPDFVLVVQGHDRSGRTTCRIRERPYHAPVT